MLHTFRPRLSLLAFLLAGAFAAQASAQEPEPAPTAPPPAATVTAAPAAASGFGAPGTWVLSMDTPPDNSSGLVFFHKVNNGATTIALNPGVDYFLAPNISLGGNVIFSHTTGNDSVFGVAVRAGYNLALAENIGFWPSARFSVLHHPHGPNESGTSTAFGVFAPFLWHPVPHFFLGLGPDLNVGLSGGDPTEFGLDFILGGWL